MRDFSSRNAAILLLDSDSLMRAVVCDALQRAGYLVTTAANLGSAVDRLNEMRPDLLMITPYIDSMRGDTAAGYLRKKHPGLPVLMVAGFMDDDRVTAQKEGGQVHIFPKPFSEDELLATVRDVLKYEWERRFVFYAPIGPIDGEFLEQRRTLLT